MATMHMGRAHWASAMPSPQAKWQATFLARPGKSRLHGSGHFSDWPVAKGSAGNAWRSSESGPARDKPGAANSAAPPLPSHAGTPAGKRCRPSGNTQGASLVLNLEGEILFGTSEAARLLKREPAALLGTPVSDVIIDLPLRRETPGYNLAYTELNFANGAWQKCRFLDQRGVRRWLEISARPFKLGSSRAFIVLLGQSLPGSRHKHDLSRLISLEDSNDDGVLITDAEGVIVYANAAFEAITGYREQEVVGNTPLMLDVRLREQVFRPEFLAGLARGGEKHCVSVNRKKSGEWYFAEQNIRPFVDHQGKVTHMIFRQRDLSGQDDSQDRLVQMAYFDGLTGLPNRNLFLDRLHHEMARATRSRNGFTLLILDVDAFKSVNDNHGHPAGDQLLQELARRLRRCIRDSDTVARLGGDEFTIILTEVTNQSDIIEVINKIKQAVSADLAVDGARLPMSVSIGVAQYPTCGENEASLIRAADQAMYEAKRAGGADWRFFGCPHEARPDTLP